MRRFSRSFKNWTCDDNETIQVTHIEAEGDTLDQLLHTAQVSFEDWHGNCTREGWTVDDMSQTDFVHLEGIFERFLDSQTDTKGV